MSFDMPPSWVAPIQIYPRGTCSSHGFCLPPANLLVDLGHLFVSLEFSLQKRSAVDEGSTSYWFECLPPLHCLISLHAHTHTHPPTVFSC